MSGFRDVARLHEAFLKADAEVRSTVCSLLGLAEPPELEEGEYIDGKEVSSSLSAKRPPDVDNEKEAVPTKKARTVVDASSRLDFGSISDPKNLLFCMVQVNDGVLIGSLQPPLVGICTMLSISVRTEESPCLALLVKVGGSDGKHCGRRNWRIGDRSGGHWTVKQLAIERIKNLPHKHRSRNSKVIDSCPEALQDALVCVSVRSSAHKDGFYSKPKADAGIADQRQKESMNIMFVRNEPYNVRLWFIIPERQRHLEARCLNVLMGLFRQRVSPLSRAQDTKGRYSLPDSETPDSSALPDVDPDEDHV